MKRIAVFASGGGSNAVKIYDYFKDHEGIEVSLVLCNNPKAGIIDKAAEWSSDLILFGREELYETDGIINALKEYKIDLIALAGFLWKIPENLVSAFSGRIVNVHPALLPKFGGHGMYGMNVHRAVYEKKEKESGPTFHLIDEEYDRGEIVFQAKCNVEGLSPEEIAKRVLVEEHKHFAPVIEKLLSN